MENQSLENLKNQINQDNLSQTIKKGRGRPKKDPNQPSTISTQQTHQSNQQFNNAQVFNVNNGELIPAFKSLYEFGDDVLADQYKDEKLKSNPAQVDFLAKNSNDVVYDFFPTINSKYIKLIMLLVTLIAVYGKKFIIVKNKEEEKKKKEQAAKKAEPQADIIPQKADTSPYPINPNKQW